MSRDEYEEDLHAELGYRTAGRRELSQHDWFSLRGDPNEAAPTPKAFEKLVNVLRATNWIKNNRARYNARDAKRKRELPAEKKKALMELQTKRRYDRYRQNAPIFTCIGCGANFCRVPWAQSRGIPPRYCTDRCKWRDHSKPRKPGPVQRREFHVRTGGASARGET